MTPSRLHARVLIRWPIAKTKTLSSLQRPDDGRHPALEAELCDPGWHALSEVKAGRENDDKARASSTALARDDRRVRLTEEDTQTIADTVAASSGPPIGEQCESSGWTRRGPSLVSRQIIYLMVI
jgi:hypothetical protein